MQSETILQALAATLLSATMAAAQVHIPATGLCNTGLTPASPLLQGGCKSSTLVTPVNPESGGPSVDGNWQLATPYPSVPYNLPGPNPCSLTSFGPAWVDAPWSAWFNPNDGLSQWIGPESDGPYTAGGWYVYRTAFPVPPIPPGDGNYILTVTGQVLADDHAVGIELENPASGQVCKPVALTNLAGYSAWTPFSFAAAVVPNTGAYLYFLVYNIEFAPGQYGNATGLRVEFTAAYFTPE
jgi:hypothetical protein